ncbi:MAG: glucokinase [Gammaproteobacteria bacterium]|nr:glucokinase [Gammaproteobacteria bacterium]
MSLLLAADVGGTKTLLALGRAGAPGTSRRYENAAFPDFPALLAAFLADEGLAGPALAAACFAVAGPAGPGSGGAVRELTNRPGWIVDAPGLARRFGIERAGLVNDFAGAALGVLRLGPDERVTLQAGAPDPAAPKLVLGPGTGLGVAALRGEDVIASEGGHVGFAPRDAEQAALWAELAGQHGRVTAERIVSGSGLAACYRHCLRRAGRPVPDDLLPAHVEPAAREANDPQARCALELFVDVFGAFAGDMAMTFLAQGGVYVVGGIAPKILPWLQDGRFLAAFNDKYEHAALAATLPVHVVLAPDVGLRGAFVAAARLAQ